MFKEATRFAVDTGKGKSNISELNAIDKAMIDAQIGNINVIEVSSILPKGIERVDDISERMGSFLPAVMSKCTGSSKELAAGLSWGLENDGSGYVIEHSKKDDYIDMDLFQDELKERLHGMSKVRDKELEKIESISKKIDVPKDEYGAVVAALVYLP